MITILYLYFSVKAGRWIEAEKQLDDIYKATRFCYSMRNNPKMFLTGFMCDDPMDSERMSRQIDMTWINKDKL